MESNVIEKEISVTGVDVTSDVKVLDSREMYKGDPGYTPVKGVDYFDGRDGVDGYTPVKGVDYFDGKDGYTPVKGIDYFDGKDGYTPQKGIDYFDGAIGPQGPQGPAGSDATVTATNIKTALGYTPADQEDVNSLSKDVEDLKESGTGGGGSSGPHEHDWYDINNAPFNGMTGDTLIWDGDTTDREVVNTYYYKVSDCTPTYEELSKGVTLYYSNLTTGVEYPSSSTGFALYDYTETAGHCAIGTSKTDVVYVYYEGNAAGVTPGIYLYKDPYYYYSRLIITDYTGFEPVSVLKDEALNPVAHTVGNYTVGHTEYYRIPTINVDKYGRVTNINPSYLYSATITRKGYIEASAYANLPVIRSTDTETITAGSLQATSDFYLHLSSNSSILPVVNVYGEYTDSSGYKHMVNCDWDIRQTAPETATYRFYWLTASISQPLDYDLTVYVISNHTWIAGM